MQHQIQAALFDLDGVVVFTDRYHYLAWKRLCDEQGWDFDEQINHRLRGIPRLASLDVILAHNRVTLTQDEKNALADRKNEYYTQSLKGIGPSDLYPGVVPFLQDLQARGIRLALCSASRNAGTVLDRLDLRRFFDVVVTGHDFTRPKPDPEIFLLGAERLGVPPFHCIVFEDAPSGVEAAHAAGMKCIGVGSPDVVSNARETIQRYDEIDVDAMLDTGRKRAVTPEPWTVTETEVDPRRTQYWETLFALTNGLLGLRGTYEEENETIDAHAHPGMYVNGIYDYEPYEHVIRFPGFPEHRHAMLNLCDWRIINLWIDDERFSLTEGKLIEYRRRLDMRHGRVDRALIWESPRGRRVRIFTRRLVSMVRRHSAAVVYQVTPQFNGRIILESVIKARVPTDTFKDPHHTDVVGSGMDADACYFDLRTRTAPFRIGMAFAHEILGPDEADVTPESRPRRDAWTQRFDVAVHAKETVRLTKYACFHTSIETPEDEVVTAAVAGVKRDRNDGFARLHHEQSEFWARYWDGADIEIEGNTPDQQAVRFAMYHLRQSHPEDDRRSISACGMTGDHYWGHVFWDTEMYIAPHFLYTQPELLRPLLMYRYHILDRARERARQMGGVGALYSWNSISGEECGIVYEASTAEYHLVSDIAYALWRYVSATGDVAFLHACGAEILFETARFLADRGSFVPLRDGRFCINVVCGPDEYGCGVNNNCYTNMLAQWHFRYACSVYERMREECPAGLASLAGRIGLKPDEPERWRQCADRMYIPFNSKLGIHEQDDSFLYLDPVDMSRVPRHTDLRNDRHPLNLWRMQVAKQADVVLLMLVLGDRFSPEVKRANYEFYEPRTNHGSSLSTSIHSIIASEIGKHDDAYAYFRHSAMMDLNDFKDNTAGGVHAACLGGTWMAVINGFAGMRDYDGGLLFNPTLPAAWTGCRFKLAYRGRVLGVGVNRDSVVYHLISGESLRFESGGRVVTLSPARPEVILRGPVPG